MPFWMPALMLMAMVLVPLLSLTPLRSAALSFSAAAPRKPETQKQQTKQNAISRC
jgi:hypothetical protein